MVWRTEAEDLKSVEVLLEGMVWSVRLREIFKIFGGGLGCKTQEKCVALEKSNKMLAYRVFNIN